MYWTSGNPFTESCGSHPTWKETWESTAKYATWTKPLLAQETNFNPMDILDLTFHVTQSNSIVRKPVTSLQHMVAYITHCQWHLTHAFVIQLTYAEKIVCCPSPSFPFFHQQATLQWHHIITSCFLSPLAAKTLHFLKWILLFFTKYFRTLNTIII